jgi:hypothetical protein
MLQSLCTVRRTFYIVGDCMLLISQQNKTDGEDDGYFCVIEPY